MARLFSSCLCLVLSAPAWGNFPGVYWRSSLPQHQPYYFAVRPLYNLQAEITAETPLLRKGQTLREWTEATVNGYEVGIPGQDAEVTWAYEANLARAAWGAAWWASEQKQGSALLRSHRMMNLLLAHNLPSGWLPEKFNLESQTWTPSKEESLTTALWMARYAQDFSPPHTAKFLASAKDVLNRWDPDALTPSGAELAATLGLKARRLVKASSLMDYLRAPEACDPAFAGEILKQYATPKQARTELYLGRQEWLPSGQAEPVAASDVQKAWLWMSLGAGMRDPFTFQLGVDRLRMSFVLVHLLNRPLQLPTHVEPIPGRMAALWVPGQEIVGPAVEFEAGPGQLLATLALVRQRFGSVYTSKAGWTVGIDAIGIDEDGPYNLAAQNDPIGAAPHFMKWVREGQPTIESDTVRVRPALRGFRLVASNPARVTALFTMIDGAVPTGHFTFGEKTKVAAKVGRFGLEADFPPDFSVGDEISFEGVYAGRRVGGVTRQIHPALDLRIDKWRHMVWPLSQSGGWSTSEKAVGMIESPEFVLDRPVHITWEAGPDCRITVADSDSGQALASSRGGGRKRFRINPGASPARVKITMQDPSPTQAAKLISIREG